MDVIVTWSIGDLPVYRHHYIIIASENCIDVSAEIPGAQK
jgi:hypothetical protein